MTRVAFLLGVCLVVAGCEAPAKTDTTLWRTDCPAIERPAPLSLEAARDAYDCLSPRLGAPPLSSNGHERATEGAPTRFY